MLKVRVKEGVLRLDNERMVLQHTLEAGFFENFFMRLVNFWKRKEDVIPLKEISMVVFERGIEKSVCPHILIYYGEKSRLIEFREDGSADLQKVLDFLEKENIELGVAMEA